MTIKRRINFETVRLETLFDLVTPGVFAFLNSRDKKIDIRHAANILVSIGRHLTEIKDGNHHTKDLVEDREKLVVWVLETGIMDYRTRLLLHAQNLAEFKRLGFALYRERPALTYRTKVEIIDNTVHVKLINKMKKGVTVGVFSNMAETEEFIEQYYGYRHGQILFPVYATNQLTKDFLLGR